MKGTFKQTFQQLRQQPLVNIISIVGTALSLFLIMLVVMLQQVNLVPYPPESNRNRMLYVKFGSIGSDKFDGTSNGPWALSTINSIYKSMKTPEAVTAHQGATRQPLSVDDTKSFTADVKLTDADFWKVFDFSFIDGKPYSEADFKAGVALAVIDKTTARKLFGTTSGVIGRTFQLKHIPYRVAGVVNDVSTLATTAYAQLWIPYTTDKVACNNTWNNGIMGTFSVTILAHDKADMAKIHDEAVFNLNKFNLTIKDKGLKLINRNRPYNTEQNSIDFSANKEPNVVAHHRKRLIIFIILLIVPAVNLSSMTHSRLRQRISEIGIRRAFGCTRWNIANQILTENMIVTLCAGILGFLLSVTCAYCFNASLFTPSFSTYSNPPLINIRILLHFSTFIYALLFCFVLNLLSTGIPALHACRTSIINDLNGRQ